MAKFFLSLTLMLLWASIVFSQDNRFTTSGYSSLTIEFSGEYPKEIELSLAEVLGPLSLEKPIPFETVNDSTFQASFYAFGPSTVHFQFDNQYFNTVLLPNESDIIQFKYRTPTDYNIEYTGVFKEIFENSSLIPPLIMGYFDYVFDENTLNAVQNTPSRSKSLSTIQEAVRQINDKPPLSTFGLFSEKLATNLMRDKLLEELNKTPKTESFLNTVITKEDADTSSLIAASYNLLLNRLINDTILEQPDMLKNGPMVYQKFLRSNFGESLENAGSLFYDMAIAYNYIHQIEAGQLLTSSQVRDIQQYFSNRDLIGYILHQNEIVKGRKNGQSTNRHYLPFEKERQVGLEDIISLYKGKVVLVDFWTTWCGPCIEAHSHMRGLKSRFTDKDVVFLYITDESSKVEQWNNYVSALDGEHYYLSDFHFDVIAEKYDIDSLPRYIAFDRTGRQYEVSEGFPGAEIIEGWINKGLDM